MQVQPADMPVDRSEVTAPWLERTLADHAEFRADPIESIRLRELGDGMGQLSVLVLADIATRSGAGSQLVIKLHAGNPDMHALALRYGYYETETCFYRDVAREVPIRTPKCYASTLDPDTGRVLIIMESFATWYSPDQVAGADEAAVRIATEHLAGLTARFWNAPIRERHPWLRFPGSAAYDSVPTDYQACVDVMLERLGGDLPASTAHAARTIAPRMRAVLDDQAQGPQALAHWDYRVENMFFGPDHQFAVIDWQLMMMTNPATDLAYLLGTNIDTGLRRKTERELMASYLEGLQRAGVQGYSHKDLERDYRRALLSVSAIPVIGGASFDAGNPRSRALFAAVGGRMFQAIEDWDALDLIPDG